MKSLNRFYKTPHCYRISSQGVVGVVRVEDCNIVVKGTMEVCEEVVVVDGLFSLHATLYIYYLYYPRNQLDQSQEDSGGVRRGGCC